MGRTIVRPVAPQRSRKTRDRTVMALFGVVLVFAVLGLVSAGVFVANHVNATGASTPTGAHSGVPAVTGNPQSVLDVARAQAQATAVVKAANDASGSIIKTAHSKAQKQASAIIAAARKQAATAPTAVPAILPSTSSSTGSALGSTNGTSSGALPYATALPLTNSSTAGAPGTAPNLAGVPAAWKVVGYGASFGAGPGSAGSISVINRSASTFSGVAIVRYANGQVASAPFSGLGPGQSAALPLNGPRFPGGKYTISLTNLK